LLGPFVVALGFGTALCAAAQATVDHGPWDQLLKRHVRDGLVHYRGFMADRQALDRYLEQLAVVEVEQLPSAADRLAFWINLYNACVVQEVLEHYPLSSVKEVPGFFTSPRCRAEGQELSIDAVGVRGHRVGGYRTHLAIVCASKGCPVLRDEAYAGPRLDAQLTQQAQAYFADPSRGLRLDETTSTVWISKIIDWNRKDFGQHSGLAGLVKPPLDLRFVDVITPYLRQDVVDRLAGPTTHWRIRVIPYDWTLNDQPGNHARWT